MRGDGWVQCCICFAFHLPPYEHLAVDLEGAKWDVCTGLCAEDAGIREATLDGEALAPIQSAHENPPSSR